MSEDTDEEILAKLAKLKAALDSEYTGKFNTQESRDEIREKVNEFLDKLKISGSIPLFTVVGDLKTNSIIVTFEPIRRGV